MCPEKHWKSFCPRVIAKLLDLIRNQLYLGREAAIDVCTFLLALQRQLLDYKKRHKKHIPPPSLPKRAPPSSLLNALLLLSLNNLQVLIFVFDPAGLEAPKIKDFSSV